MTLLLAGAVLAAGSSGLTSSINGPNTDATTATWNAESQLGYSKTAGTAPPYIGYTNYKWPLTNSAAIRLTTLNYYGATMYGREVIYHDSTTVWEDCPQNMMNSYQVPQTSHQNLVFTYYYTPYPSEVWVANATVMKLKVQTKSTTSATVASEGTL